MTHIVNIDTMN